MAFKKLRPEVAGGLGPDATIDNSVFPPRIRRLHYQFDGWLGDDLLETFPCFIVSSRLKEAIEQTGLSGFCFDDVHVSISEQFMDLHPGRRLPKFFWFKVTGKPGVDDFGVTAKQELVVSDKGISVLREFQVSHCEIIDYV
jgi:hypothetical protein